MSSLNEANIIGNVGKDPEIRHTQSGDKVASFSVATTEKWRNKSSGEMQEATEWHRIVVWNEHIAQIVEKFVAKGTKVMVRGKLQTRKWTDNKGAEKYTTEIVLNRFDGKLVLLGGTKERGEAEDSAPPPPKDLDDEIPF